MTVRNHLSRAIRVRTALRSSGRLTVWVLAFLLGACGQVSYTPEQHLERGIGFQQEGDLSAASIEFRNALQQDPGSAEGRYRLGMLLLNAGDGAGAAQELGRALEHGWDQEEVRLPLLRAVLLQGQYGRVLDETALIESFIEAQVPDALTLRGLALLGIGNPQQAQESFTEALNRREDITEAYIGMAVAGLRAGGSTGEARQWADRALASNSASAQAWALLGSLERSEDRLEEAEAAFGRAIHSAALPHPHHVDRALVRIAQENFSGAEEDLRAMRRLNPRSALNGYVQGLFHYHQGHYAEAQSAFEESLSRVPDFQPAVFALGVSHFVQEHWGQAESNLARFLRAHPDTNEASQLLALVRLRQGDVGRAERVLAPLLNRSPDDVLALNAMADISFSRGQYGEGLKYLRHLVSLEPEDPLIRASLASGLLQAGEREEGLRELDAAVDLSPEGMHEAAISIILERLRASEYDEALLEAERLAAREGSDPAMAFNLIGLSHLGLRNLDAAETAFREGLERSSGPDVELRTNLSELLEQRGRIAEAEAVLEEGLYQYPDELRLLLKLAQLRTNANDSEGAHVALQRALEANPEALEPRLALARHYLSRGLKVDAVAVLEPARAAHGDSLEWLRLLATARHGTGDLEGSAETLRRLAELQPESFEAHFTLGRTLLELRRALEGVLALERSLELDPGHLGRRLAAVQLLIAAGQFDAAAQALAPAQAMAFPDPRATRAAASIALGQGRFEDAVEKYREALRQAPDDRTLTAGLATAQWSAGERTESLATIRQWLSKHPTDQQMRWDLASGYMDLGEYGTARKEYEVLLQQNPQNAGVHNNLAWLLREEDPKHALRLAERAVALAPERADMLDTLGVIQLQLGRNEEALVSLTKSAEIAPENASIQLHFAQALRANGLWEAAEERLQAIMAEHPDTSASGEARALLKGSR